MKIDSAHFRNLIEGPVALSSRRSALAELSYVRLSATGGRITVEGSSFDAHQHSFGECVGDLEPVCVVGTKLRDALVGFDGDIEITPSEGRLRFSGAGYTGLSTVDASKFSATPSIDGTPVEVDTAELSDAIKSVAWCTSTDKTRENIQGVNVEGNEVAATNGTRVAVAEIKANFGEPMFFHNHSIPLACNALSLDGAKLLDSENHIIIDHTAQRVWIRKTEGKFAPYKSVFFPDNEFIGAVDAVKFNELITAAASLYDQAFAYTGMEFTETGIKVAQKSPTSEFNKVFPGSFKPMRFGVRADWLKGVLAPFEGEVEIWGRDELSPLVFKAGPLKTLISAMRWQE